MKRYFCSCSNEVFFENTICKACNGNLGFIPELQTLVKVEPTNTYRFCQHRATLHCNWLITHHDQNSQCMSCRLTRTIPNLSISYNLQRWQKLETTKRRAIYMLLRLQLPIPDRNVGHDQLLFDFLEDKRSNRFSKLDMVFTGHSSGLITLNVAEADDSYRSAAQHKMQEAYRTLLGHFRHELGHFYWLRMLTQNSELAAFRQLFGEDAQDYQTCLKQFYRHGARTDWSDQYISAYASAHPLEDWAECWAHYLHIRETLETAAAFDLITVDPNTDNFADCLSIWMRFSVILNALNRSMGISDPYPFQINSHVEKKLHFIDKWIARTFSRP